MTARVALVTARVAAATDADLPPLLRALADAGLSPEAACWDDPEVDWSSYRLAVLRSPWDYVPRYEEFLGWLDRTALATTVLNRPEVVRWSTDKRYLRDLAAHRVPVVPTAFFEPDEPWPDATRLDPEDRGDHDRSSEGRTKHDLVVKPWCRPAPRTRCVTHRRAQRSITSTRCWRPDER